MITARLSGIRHPGVDMPTDSGVRCSVVLVLCVVRTRSWRSSPRPKTSKYPRLRADSVVQAAIADTRSLATEMMKGMRAVPDEAFKVTGEIQAAIRRIDARVYVPPGPDSLPRY